MKKTAPDGNDMIDEIAKEANLDFFFDRNPKLISDDEFRDMIVKERANRALFIEKKGK